MATEIFQLFRRPSKGSDGGTADWAIRSSDKSSLTIKYGKTGSKLRTVEKKKMFPSNVKMQELIAEKTNGDYDLVGLATIADNGTVVLEKDMILKVWAITDIPSSLFAEKLRALADQILDYSYKFSDHLDDVPPLEAEYDPALRSITFKCDGYLPNAGWQLKEQVNEANPDISEAGGKLDFPIQLLILTALSREIGLDHVSVVLTKGQVDTQLIPERNIGLTSYFVDEIGLPRSLVLNVGRASKLIPPPMQIIAKGATSTPVAFTF